MRFLVYVERQGPGQRPTRAPVRLYLQPGATAREYGPKRTARAYPTEEAARAGLQYPDERVEPFAGS